MTTTLRFPSLPPSTNELYYNSPGKGRRKSKRYIAWLNVVKAETRGQKCKSIDGPVYIRIALKRPPDHVRRDVDNCLKALVDLAVDWGIIDGDDHRTVHGINAYWTDAVDGVELTICSVIEALPHKQAA